MNKIQPDNVDLSIWFSKLANEGKARVFKLSNTTNVHYKGFKIIKSHATKRSPSKYYIYDTTLSFLDDPVSDNHLKMMEEYGVVKGIDLISMKRTQRQLKLKQDEVARIQAEIEKGALKEYFPIKLEELTAEIASMELTINRTINKYKLNGK